MKRKKTRKMVVKKEKGAGKRVIKKEKTIRKEKVVKEEKVGKLHKARSAILGILDQEINNLTKL